ncbi:MAG TPA: enolase C-terminal domain-like protein [Myxococcales bacterium]|jgi:L-alanine-DL-glutamate epimerase-like enolase superfamily enzyme|nr:enolase C-terminal domain-like protein [Myxococcales bacterium]
MSHELPALEVRPYRLRLHKPFRSALGVALAREGFVVLAHDGGLTGRGEACIVPELGTESFAECQQQLSRPNPRTPAARHAVELAMLDLQAQRAGVPLARMLEAAAVLDVPVSALLDARSNAELARDAARAVAEGFGTVKLKAGLADDFARAAVVRDAAGPAVKLRLDANGAWDSATALLRLHELAPLGIELCEQPTPDLLGLGAAAVTIAADELVLGDFEASLARAQVIVLKPMLLGGLLPALGLARRAIAAGRKVLVTTSIDGAIARAGAAHLAAAVLGLGPGFGDQPAAGLATGRLLAEDLCEDTLAPRGGMVRISGAPGLGL